MATTTPPNLSPIILNGSLEESPIRVKRRSHNFSFDASFRPLSYSHSPQIMYSNNDVGETNGPKSFPNSYIGTLHANHYQNSNNPNGNLSLGIGSSNTVTRSTLLNEQVFVLRV